MKRPLTLGILLEREMESALLKQIEEVGVEEILRSSKRARRALILKLATKFISEEAELTKAWVLCEIEARIEEERERMQSIARTQQAERTETAGKSAKTKARSKP